MTTAQLDGDVDAAFTALGHFGIYTLSQWLMNVFAIWAVAMAMFSVVFTGQDNLFICPETKNGSDYHSAPDANSTTGYERTYGSECAVNGVFNVTNSSEISATCSPFDVEYERPKYLSFVSEFDLVCDRHYLIGFSQMLLTLGHVIASLIVPFFTDKYGRRPVILICSFFSILSCIGLATSVNYTMFAAFKLLVGIFIQGAEGVNVTIVMETLPTKYRSKMFGCLGAINWTCGMLFLVLLAYLLQDFSWRVLEYAIASCFLYIIIEYFFLTETLRWLAANNRVKQFHATLKRAARWNRKNYETVLNAFYGSTSNNDSTAPEMVKLETSNESKEKVPMNSSNHTKENIPLNNLHNEEDDDSAPVEHLTIWHLMKDPALRIHTIFCFVSWFFNSLTYFALTLMSSTLSGSIYINFTLNAIAEVPQSLIIFFFMEKLGRRILFSGFSVLAGFTLLAMAAVRTLAPEQFAVITTLAILGKLGITGSFTVMYLYAPELFPTNLRNMGLGASYMGARVGGMLAPFGELLMETAVYAPGLVFGLSSLALSLFVFLLPETTGVQLPQTLAEMKLWEKASFSCRLPKEEDHHSSSIKRKSKSGT